MVLEEKLGITVVSRKLFLFLGQPAPAGTGISLLSAAAGCSLILHGYESGNAVLIYYWQENACVSSRMSKYPFKVQYVSRNHQIVEYQLNTRYYNAVLYMWGVLSFHVHRTKEIPQIELSSSLPILMQKVLIELAFTAT